MYIISVKRYLCNMEQRLTQPLAEELRPHDLASFIGQEHLMAKGAVLRNSLLQGNIPSIILWGPPGVGKTTLAHLISDTLGMRFFTLSAISSGVKDVRAVINTASGMPEKAILFIDEIHRFSKSQQDSLLGAVEKGIVTLIGATTENPSFEVIAPLLSRCQIYLLKPLNEQHLELLLKKAVKFYADHANIKISVEETEALFRFSGGDARKLYNAIELVVNILSKNKGNTVGITNKIVVDIIQENLAIYDKQGEMHYDIISAFIKSVRGSDPNAAVYWLARMIAGGEDPKFIARRLLILAAEDIGLANPNALLLANTCFDAVNKTGWPESRIILSETTIYLATSQKSNTAYMAINDAQSCVSQTGNLPVPMHIRNAPTKLMKDLNYGKDYKYAHNYPGNFTDQEFMPKQISGKILYKPGNNSLEQSLLHRLKSWWFKRYKY
jgi:putative ATPase